MAPGVLCARRGPTATWGLPGRVVLRRAGGRACGVRALWAGGTSVPGRGCPGASLPPHLQQTARVQSWPSPGPCGAGSDRRSRGTAPASPETAPDARPMCHCRIRESPGWPIHRPRALAWPLGRRALPSARVRCRLLTVHSARESAPFLRLHIPLERGVHVLQGLGHAHTRWMQGPPLIVVEDAAYRRAIIEHHILRRLIRLDCVGWGGLAWRREQRG